MSEPPTKHHKSFEFLCIQILSKRHTATVDQKKRIKSTFLDYIIRARK